MARYHQRPVTKALGSIPDGRDHRHHWPMKETNPNYDALLVFLANWEQIERSELGRILSAGQLADVQELERIFTLPSESPDDCAFHL
jgi:hypothetical protein